MSGIRCPGCDYEIDECTCFEEDNVPKFEKTFCSQCGGEFGPGENGYSHCSDHKDAPLAQHLDHVARLKDAIRACLRAFEAGKDVPCAVVPREKFLDELRTLVR